MNSIDKYRFVRQKAAKEVELIHKELLVNQVYENDELFKTGKNINVTSKLLSGECVTISKNTITADKRGKAVVQVKRKNTKTDKKKIYQIHFTVPNYVAKSVGYTNDDVTVYHCAKTSCAIRKLKKNTKVVVKAYVGERLKIEYELNGETKKGYVAANKVSWVEISPMLVAEKEKTESAVLLHNISGEPDVSVKEWDKSTAGIDVHTENGKSFIKITGKAKGFTQVQVVVGDQYKTFIPVSVYESLKVDNARVNKKVNFKSGASDKNENVINFRKFKVDKKLTILGKCNGFFCVKVSSTDIGIKGKGFVNKDRISYLKLKKETCTVSKGKTKKIELKAYNTKASEVEWKNENGKVSFSKQTVSKNNNMRTITYLVKGKAVGTANATIKHKKLTLKDKCFISVYDKITTSPGFMKENGAVRKGAAQVSDNCPKVGDRAKHQKVKVKGKCGDYYFVKYGEKKGFVLKSKVAYLSFKTDKYTMKQYDTKKDLKAKIVNSNQDGKIKFELNKKKLAEIKKVKETKKKVQKPHLYAKKEGKVKITASYTNAGGVTVKKGIEVKIKNIKFFIQYGGKRKLFIVKERFFVEDPNPKLICPKINLNVDTDNLLNKKVSWYVNGKGYGKKEQFSYVFDAEGTYVIEAKYKNTSDKIEVDVLMDRRIKNNVNIEYFDQLKSLMSCSMKLCNDNIENANMLIFQYMRKGVYDGLGWKYTAGKIDSEKVEKLKEEFNNTGFFGEGNNPMFDSYNNIIDIRHLCASINAYIYDTDENLNNFFELSEDQMDLCASAIGDYASGLGNYFAYAYKINGGSIDDMKVIYESMVDRYKKSDIDGKIKFAEKEEILPNMTPTDMLEDIDAYVIFHKLKSDRKLTFFDAYIDYYKNDLGSGLKIYKQQFEQKQWNNLVESTLKNSQIKDVILDGISAIPGTVDKNYIIYDTYFDKYYQDAAYEYLWFIETTYKNLR